MVRLLDKWTSAPAAAAEPSPPTLEFDAPRPSADELRARHAALAEFQACDSCTFCMSVVA
jgi:hypothetical protein